MGAYRITVRVKAKVEHERADDLQDALAALEGRGRRLAAQARVPAAGGTLVRRFEPVQQVFGRIELSGPGGVRAGVDVRGDGSAEAWTGGWRRAVVLAEPGETPYDAVLRALS